MDVKESVLTKKSCFKNTSLLTYLLDIPRAFLVSLNISSPCDPIYSRFVTFYEPKTINEVKIFVLLTHERVVSG